jgi:hypothetical protein
MRTDGSGKWAAQLKETASSKEGKLHSNLAILLLVMLSIGKRCWVCLTPKVRYHGFCRLMFDDGVPGCSGFFRRYE